MAGFAKQTFTIAGIETAVFSAGTGQPILFLHGAGTATGFDALLPLAERFRLIVPHHPGFGESADDPAISTMHDYRRHYLDLFDALGLTSFALVGHSMGGHLAAILAIDHGERVSRLVLGAPLGLHVPEAPTVDLFSVPDQELLAYLAHDPKVFAGKVPLPPTPEFLAKGYREMTSAARVLWERTSDPRLPRWLHRVKCPTLILWGDRDRLIPVGQAEVWAAQIAGASIRVFPGVGHLLFDESEQAVKAIGEFALRGRDK